MARVATEKGAMVADYSIPKDTPNWDVPLNANLTDINNRVTGTESGLNTQSGQITVLQSQVGSLQASPSYQVYNVKSSTYGAVGDGTHDDTSAIQNAINAASTAGGGVVYLPAGTYKISSALTLANRITLRGDGDFVTNIVQSSTTANGLVGSNLIYIIIEHLRLTGPGSGSGEGMNFTTEFDYCILRDVSTTGWGSTGIEIEQPIVTNLTRVTSFNNGGAGIYIHGNAITGAGTSVSLDSCWTHDNASNGFSIQNMTYCSFQACASDNQANSGKAGYLLNQCTAFTFNGCGSEGNNFGWELTGSSTGIVINSPYIFNTPSTGVGIWVTGGSTNVQMLAVTETLPQSGAAAAVKVDTGCTATIQGIVATTANSLAAGTTVVAANASGVRSYPNGVTTPSLTMTGPIAMGTNKVTGLANGTAASDAAAFGQIPVAGTTAGTYAAGNDSRITGALQTTGGTMSGAIAMGTNKITGIGNGSAAQDAAAFGQIPVAGTTAGTYAAGNDSRITGALQSANNLSDVAAPVTSAQNLGILAKATSTAESNATTTLQASTSLVVPVKANSTYLLQGNICWTNNTAGNGTSTGGFKHSFTGPSGATLLWADSSGSQMSTIGTVDTWSTPTGANSTVSNWISGVLAVGSTAGNLTVTFAPQFSGTGQLLPASNIRLIRIA